MYNSSVTEHSELVSVVVPAYNAEKTVQQTVDSILNQTHTKLEILLVDDCSTDDTCKILESNYHNVQQFLLLKNDKNQGVCRTRNMGILAARGEFVVCVDADDILHPQALSILIDSIAQRSDIAMTFGATLAMNEQGLVRVPFEPIKFVAPSSNQFQGFLGGNLVGHGSGVMFRKSFAVNFGCFDETLRASVGEGCADWLFYLNMSQEGLVVVVPAVTVGYRRGCISMSSDSDAMVASHTRVLEVALRLQPNLSRDLLKRCATRFRSARIIQLILKKHFLQAARYYIELWLVDSRFTWEFTNNHANMLFERTLFIFRQSYSDQGFIDAWELMRMRNATSFKFNQCVSWIK